MSEVLDLMFEHLMVAEGGYVNDPRDPGGETKYGISKKAYPNLDIKNLTKEQAKQIFIKDYWNKIRGDELPPAIAIMVADFAYNSGYKTAIKKLQQVLGVTADGLIGNQTLNAIHNKMSGSLLIKYMEARLSYLRCLKTFSVYGKGWTNRVRKNYELATKYV